VLFKSFNLSSRAHEARMIGANEFNNHFVRSHALVSQDSVAILFQLLKEDVRITDIFTLNPPLGPFLTSEILASFFNTRGIAKETILPTKINRIFS
jgi:hypothetical protein